MLFIILFLFGLVVAIISVLFFLFFVYLLFPSIHGAPFVSTDDATAWEMVKLADIKQGDRVADLGAGDGCLVIACARAGAEAHGFEINPFLVLTARRNIKRAGLAGKAFVHRKNFWREDLSGFNVITMYGITYIMKGLEEKLQRELKQGARVVSNYFTFPHWECAHSEGKARLYRKA